MFLSLMTLLQTNLPCSINYFRYKANYEDYMDKDGTPSVKKEGDKVKLIASPKLISKFSPVQQFTASAGINVNPATQKHLLKYAKRNESSKKEKNDGSSSDEDGDYSKFQSKKTMEESKKRRE